jgi:hypothetical protein
MSKDDIQEFKRIAQNYWLGYPTRMRLLGEHSDVPESDFWALSFYEAALVILNMKAYITQEALALASVNFEPICKQGHY